nr:unnamed protein product [Digitaria exilis]
MAPPLPSLSSGIHAQHHDESVVQAVAERAMPEYDRRGLAMSGVVPDPRPAAALSVRKLAVCSSGVVAAVVGDGHLGKIALCRPGAAAWSSLSNQGQWRRTKDMAMHQGTLYAVDHNEDLLAVSIVGGEDDDDGAPPALSAIARVITGDPPSFSGPRRLTLHYLVSDSGGGELLMVRREVCRERPGQGRGIDERFTVFKADLGSSRGAPWLFA